MRELRLVFGATTASVAAVLAIFMGGLGLGSAVLGKLADRAANPLRMYGYLEAAIALSAAVSPWLIELAGAIYLGLGGQAALGLTGATAIRLALAAAVLLVPTFLMGGTLPAAVRAGTPSDDANRRALGLLYGSNTVGAVLGCAAATFFSLEQLGTRATLWTGCAISLLVGMIAVRRSRTLAPQGPLLDRPQTAPPREANRDRRLEGAGAEADARPILIYLTAGVLGFTFFALELVWYRMLAPILGGTTFTFGLILCVALAGIGVGGVAYNVIFRRLRPSWSALAVTCACEALFTMIPYALGDRLALIAAWRADAAADFGHLVLGWSYVTCIVVLPTALVSGIQFPLLTALLGHGRREVSKHLGATYAWNTLGAIAGSLVAGFGALPLLTAPGLWQAIAALLAVLSVGILVAAPGIRRGNAIAVAGLSVMTVGCFFAQGPTAAWRHGGIGAGRAQVPTSDPNRIRQWQNEKRRTLEWEADGIESSIGIVAGDGINFYVNGKSDGNSLVDAPTQIGVAILGAMLHPDPQTALVIGLGTGESAGWLAEMRQLRRVDVVEIEPAIDEMARRCSELNWDVLNHPRVERIYNDGREFVFATDETYDLILSEPSNPYRAGIASLYTTEFYRAVRQRLNPGGLFIQWLQAYEVDERSVHIVLATARRVFDYVEVWQSLPGDLQLVCSSTPIEYSAGELRERMSGPVVKDALAEVWKANDLESFLGRFVANSQWADEIAATPRAPINTDDRTILEYRFAKTVGRETPFSVEPLRDRLRAAGYHRPALGGQTLDWNQVELRRQEFNLVLGGQLSIALLPRAEDRAVVEAFEYYKNNRFAETIAIWPAEHSPASTDIQRLVLARSYAELGRSECLELIAASAERFPAEAAALRSIYHWRAGNVAEAARALDEFYAQLRESPWVMAVFAETAVSRTIDVAKADREAAERLYAMLSEPFASRRFGQIRILARFMVAEQLGAEYVVAALGELEPHIVWTREVLRPRAAAYAAVNHPLAAQAEHDWQWYRRQAQ